MNTLEKPSVANGESLKIEQLKNDETQVWRELLGVEVEIPPVPAYLNAEIITNLEKYGLALRAVPKLELGTINQLIELGPEAFLEQLHQRYPNWKIFESLSDTELFDSTFTKLPSESYWEDVATGRIEFPSMPGRWLAVETFITPEATQFLTDPPALDKLLDIPLHDGFFDYDYGRFMWNVGSLKENLAEHKTELLATLQLPSTAEPRLLSMVEWNLLTHREQWITDGSAGEWTGDTNLSYEADLSTSKLFLQTRHDSRPKVWLTMTHRCMD
jgi:hypothetical protein